MRLTLLERFTLNTVMAPERGLEFGGAHVVCTVCDHKYDGRLDGELVPEYWFVWAPDQMASQLLVWMYEHIKSWHPEEMGG